MAGIVNIENAELMRVSQAIDANNIDQIAMGHLDLTLAEVRTVRAGAMGNQFDRVFNILDKWRNRNSTIRNVNLRWRLYQCLRNAAAAGLINQADIEFLNQPPV